MRKLVALIVLLVLAGAGLYMIAGSMEGPAIEIVRPGAYVGVASPVEVAATTPGAHLSALQIEVEQNGTRTPLVEEGAELPAPDENGTVHVTRRIDKTSVPGLASGPARIVVTAARPVLRGLRTVETVVTHDVTVRLERPRLSVISTHHYVNQGGAEMIVYRVTPDDVDSGVAVGDIEYPGYPATGVQIEGISIADPAVRVAFFALLYDQSPDTPMHLFARDQAGNETTVEFEHRTFAKRFRQSRIPLDDRFLGRVVPAILAGTTEVAPTGSLIDQYVVINSELRRKNAATIASFAQQTAPELLWRGVAFHPFTNNAVESAFADRRTYVYDGREVDQQTHLGFDLASVAQASIVAANRGKVLFADELGIYGNAVIIDHGMGVQSLYGHLSSIGVSVGQMVEKDQEIGRSGMTGLAGGDHLHFTMLVSGQMINPIEWWDPHWIEDRILRKLRGIS